jgi:hypothetical protein
MEFKQFLVEGTKYVERGEELLYIKPGVYTTNSHVGFGNGNKWTIHLHKYDLLEVRTKKTQNGTVNIFYSWDRKTQEWKRRLNNNGGDLAGYMRNRQASVEVYGGKYISDLVLVGKNRSSKEVKEMMEELVFNNTKDGIEYLKTLNNKARFKIELV